ncbi:hypothetical protein Aperf_G00000079780 [Anoplocephala perfoliata]
MAKTSNETVPEVDPACNASNEICITIAAGGSPVRIHGYLNSVSQHVIYSWGANYAIDIYPKKTMSPDELGNATTVMPVPQFPEKCTRIITAMNCGPFACRIRANPGDCVSVLQILQTLIHGTKPKEDPACNPDETLCVKVIGKQNVFIRGTLPRVPYIVSAKLGLLIRSKAPPPIVIPPSIVGSTEKTEKIDETTSGWTDKSTAETSGENDHTGDGSETTINTGLTDEINGTGSSGEMGGTEEVEEDHSGSTTEDLYEGSETTMNTGGTEEIRDTPPAEPDITTEQINDFSSDTEMEGSDLTATAVTEDNNVDHSGVTTDYLEAESETTENTGSSEQISDFTSDTEMEVSDFIAISSESTSQQPNEGSTTASLISTTTSLEHPSPEPRCITSMNCNSRTCRGVASVGDCVDVTKNLNCFIRATVPHVKSNCNSTLGICVWTPDYGVVKINGTLPKIPYQVTVDRGFPVGNFVFDFVEGTKQGNKIASASSQITHPSHPAQFPF